MKFKRMIVIVKLLLVLISALTSEFNLLVDVAKVLQLEKEKLETKSSESACV